MGKKATKATSQLASEVTQDVKESLFGDIKPLDPQEKQKLQQQEQAKQKRLQQMSVNMQTLNKQIEEIRQKIIKREEQKKYMEQNKQERKFEEKKKKESVLAKLLKTRAGTKEGMQRASGWFESKIDDMLHDRQPSRPNESLTWPQLLKGEAISTLTVGMVGLIVMLAINEYRTATAFLVLDMLAAGAYLVGRQFDKTSPPLPLTEKAPTIIIVGPFHDLTVTEYAASSSIPKHGDIAVMVSKIPTDPTLN